MNIDELKQRLQQPYDRAAWQAVLREVFPSVEILAQPHAVHCTQEEVAAFRELGSVRLYDGKKLAIFEIALAPQKQLQRNRVGLRNLVAGKIDQETCHGVLVIFTGQNDDYRFTFVAKESEFNEDGEFVERQTATKRFTYLLGPHETCTTAARRLLQLADKKERATLTDVVEAFSVEKLNKEFFSQYKEHYANFVAHLLGTGIPQRVFGIPRHDDAKEQDKANKPVRDFAKRLLGRLVFLHFLQKKGWLGCPAERRDWIDGDRDFVRNLFRSCPEKGKFFSKALAPLFFDALNRADRQNDIFAVTGTRVPYLNGGLFEHEHLPNDHQPLPVTQLDFPAVLFENLLEFFGQYNFTIDENDPDDHEVGIDPEMLGHIFENLLEDNKDKGAFYTPKAIVQYMCQQSLIHYLHQHLGEREELERLVRFKDAGSATDKHNWVRQNARRIEEVLDRVKICDPAIGSGAFPIGLLQEIYWIKLTLDWTLDPAETKLKIIQNSIYGVDIDAGAVEIARLRFWLALIVDEDEPRPLPNLDYKIMQGDSLLESFEGIPLDRLHQAETFKVTVFEKSGQTQLFSDTPLFHHTDQGRAQEIVELIQSYFGETNPTRKQALHQKIDRFVLDHIDYNLKLAEEKYADELQLYKGEIGRKQKIAKDWKPSKKTLQRIHSLENELTVITEKNRKLKVLEDEQERPYFLWKLFFLNIFEENGFDIVIGNPPYVDSENMVKNNNSYRTYLADLYKVTKGNWDLYIPFFEKAYNLLKPGGIFGLITPNKWLSIGYGKEARNLLAKDLVHLCNCSNVKVFEAGNSPVISFVKKNNDFSAVTVSEVSKNWRIVDLGKADKGILIIDNWGMLLSKHIQLLIDISSNKLNVKDFSSAENPFTTSEAYELCDIIDDKNKEEFCFKLINTGTIDPFVSLWGKKTTSYLKRKYQYPVINIDKFKSKFPKRYEQSASCKIIISGMRHFECYYDFDGSYVAGKSTIIVRKFTGCNPKSLLAILNSKLISFYIRESYSSLGIDGGINFSVDMVESLPVPEFGIYENKLCGVVDEIIKNITDDNYVFRAKLESELNKIVYEIYGLTPEEVAIVEGNVSAPKKNTLFANILVKLCAQSAYFSLAAVKRAMAEAEIELADDTLREYMSEAMKTGIVSDAGRGWYSRHTQPVTLDPKPVAKIIREVKKAFPLLDFCCWSTVQLNPFAQHLIAQPTIFLYADGDAHNAVVDTLRSNGWDAWANPGIKHAEQFIRPGEKTVVLRPSKGGQPEGKEHVAPIEKALVDLIVEANRLRLMDTAEVQRIHDGALASGLLQLPVLFGYAEDLKKNISSREITH